jgi:hypothetical protein
MSTLLSDIEAFLGHSGLSEWAFGEKALNDRHFVRQLRAGREHRRATEARARNFMATYQASEAEAPAEAA